MTFPSRTNAYRDDDRTPKQQRSREREERILAAALKVFAREGIAKARVADIAAEAGVPSSSVYDYFENKEELAYFVPVSKFAEFYDEYYRKERRLRTARERLRLFFTLAAEFAQRNPDWARVLHLEVWPSVLVKDARVRSAIDEYGRIVVELIKEGGENEEWPPEPDSYMIATIMMGATQQVIVTWLMYGRPADPVSRTRDVIDRLFQLLDRPAAGANEKPGKRRRKSPTRKARAPET